MFADTVEKMGIRKVQNSLCIMFLKHNNKRLAMESLKTSDLGVLAEMVEIVSEKESTIGVAAKTL